LHLEIIARALSLHAQKVPLGPREDQGMLVLRVPRVLKESKETKATKECKANQGNKAPWGNVPTIILFAPKVPKETLAPKAYKVQLAALV
jgi:hypothetical protein